MPKIKPERIAGIVALSYLVLIPVAAAYAYRKIQIIDRDLRIVWDNEFPGAYPRTPLFGDKLTEAVEKVLDR